MIQSYTTSPTSRNAGTKTATRARRNGAECWPWLVAISLRATLVTPAPPRGQPTGSVGACRRKQMPDLHDLGMARDKPLTHDTRKSGH